MLFHKLVGVYMQCGQYTGIYSLQLFKEVGKNVSNVLCNK